jgi:hypothetical protein
MQVAQMLWLIPAVPIVASGVIALLKQPKRKTAAALAIGSMCFSLLLTLIAFAHVLAEWTHGVAVREVVNFTWIQVGSANVDLGWVLDPLSAVMMVMVSFVGLLIFIYSIGYMAEDDNFTRFFCFMSLFAGAMLGVVIANSLLLLFMCWELVGLTSYLLIGFWYQRPAASAAAQKAFITTRIGDVLFLLGMVWLFSQTGTLLFYNHGAGSMEAGALAGLLAQPAALGLTAAGAIGLLIFAGAAGKSGQFPAACVAPGRHGRPHAGLRADSRCNHGSCGRLSDRKSVSADAGRRAGRRNHDCTHRRYMDRRIDCGLCRADRRSAERHQAHPGLLHHLATRLHDGRPRHGRRCDRHLPPDYPRLLQGAALHGSGLGDSRLPRGAGRAAHGRAQG